MKRKLMIIVALALCLVMICPLTACAKENKKKTKVTNPWVECKNVKEAEASAGFRLSLPSSVGAFDATIYRAYPEQSIEAVYETESCTVTVRKAEGSNLDISGNMESYKDMGIRYVNGATIISKGNDGAINQTMVFYDNYSWSLYSPDGYPENGLDEFIDAILGGFNTQITVVYTD